MMIKSGQFNLEVISHKTNGEVIARNNRGHALIKAVNLAQMATNCLIHERWDQRELFLNSIHNLLNKTKDSKKFNPKTIQNYFKDFIQYFESQRCFENQVNRPWLKEDLSSPEYEPAMNILTTTDFETLQLICYLVKQYRPKCLVELGCWMGCSSLLMALASTTYTNINK